MPNFTLRALVRSRSLWSTVGVALLSLQGVLANGPSPAIPRFIEETEASGLKSRFDGDAEYMVGGGVATFDCDADGLPDVFITGGVNKSKFYKNRSTQGGPLKLQEERSGLEVTNAIGAYPIDMDADGQVDLVVLRVGEVQVFRGEGGCKFTRANTVWNIKTSNAWHTAFSATWEQGQRWPTLAIGTYVDRTKPQFPWGSCTPGILLRPAANEPKYAAPEPLSPGHCALSMLFSDWNRSGHAALRVSNDREYYKNGQEQLWQFGPGQSPNLFTREQGWKPLQIWGMGIASHDVDGDGFPDVFLTSMSDNKLQSLESGAAQPRYADSAYRRGITAHRPYVGGDVHPSTAWHAQFSDVNNDGYADLFIVKGNVSSMPDFAALDPNNLLLQRPDGSFLEAGDKSGVGSFKRGRGGMVADLNGDGLLDVLVVNRWDNAQVWRNVGSGTADKPAPMGRWLALTLAQAGGNRNAVGAWVEVDLGEQVDPPGARTIRQELTVGGGHASGHWGWMHFGVGSAKNVKVRVQWPHGAWSAWTAVDTNQFYVVDQQQGTRVWSKP
jgi:hypothetical protein